MILMVAGILVKVHEYHRRIIAICDAELLGRKLEQDPLQLEINKDFYGGEEVSEKELQDLLEDSVREDATFNIVGERAIAIAIKAGVVGEQGIIRIQGVPHALRLL